MARKALTAIIFLGMSCWCTYTVIAKEKPEYWNGSFAKYVEVPGATRVGAESCSTCHSDVAKDFRHAFHSQRGVECEDCHGPGSLHVDGNGDVTKIINLRSRAADAANGVCLSCHVQAAAVRNWMGGTHAAEHLRCTDCHQVHSQAPQASAPVARMAFDTTTPGSVTFAERLQPESAVKMAPGEQINESCLKCHQSQRAQMSLPYHHPLPEGKLTCLDCHNPHGGPGGKNLRVANVNQLCLSCHAQYRGPYMYQHPPVNEDCLICHSPHGSPNIGMLSVSQPALCLQCHAGHHDGASLPLADRCTNCHASIHGTDVPTPRGGSRFVDKGNVGVPSEPGSAAAMRQAQARTSMPLVTAHAPTNTVLPSAMRSGLRGGASTFSTRNQPALVPSHIPMSLQPGSPFAAGTGAMFGGDGAGAAFNAASPYAAGMGAMSGAFPMSAWGAGDAAGVPLPNSYGGFYFTPGAYRFLNVTGYGSRVGQYDSLQEGGGGGFEADYISVPYRASLVTRATVLTGSDFHVASQLNVGDTLEFGADLRSFVEQQDYNAFYAGVISPDIGTTNSIAPGSIYGIKRRLGSAYARLKLPNLPVHAFVKGDWQARVGHEQLGYLDENIDTTCTTCHYTSELQAVNYTTRDIGAGLEVDLPNVNLIYEHDYSSFNDRLPYPTGVFGPFENEDELLAPLPLSALPDTPAGNYYLDIPAQSRYSADSLSLNWTASTELIFSGQASYRRMRDIFTANPQNAFDANAMVSWHPRERLRLTGDFRQQNLVNDFVPYFPLYGDMSYHEHWAGLKADYELARHLDLEGHYRNSGISRSNAFLWPQIYSPDNTDLQTVVPSSFSNTTGLALRYHPDSRFSARGGYEWTGTHNPGYLLIPGSNSRIFGDVVLAPKRWLILTNDANFIVQNAFPVIERRNRFYVDTADATFGLLKDWNLDLGYSYQQNNLGTYMAFQNDSTAGYVVDEPFVPYRQLSQTYWVKSGYKFKNRVGVNLGLLHNSAHSGMLPNLNPNDPGLLSYNSSLIAAGTFNPGLFAQALSAIGLGATTVSQVNVPQFIGQGKVYYVLPHGFDTGLLVYYGTYKDFTNPGLDGILRSYNVYIGRSW